MKKFYHVYSRHNNDLDGNLLFAMVMGGFGLFTGFFIWFILSAIFGGGAMGYLLLSILLAVSFFVFGLLQPEKAARMIDQVWKYFANCIRQVFKKNIKNN